MPDLPAGNDLAEYDSGGSHLPKPEVCVGAIILRLDELLLIRRGHGPAAGEWSLPGGHLESGETLAEAVVREVAEETGLEVVCGPFVGTAELITDAHHFVVLDFEAIVMGSDETTAGSDAAEARWVPLADIDTVRLTDGLVEFLEEFGYLNGPSIQVSASPQTL